MLNLVMALIWFLLAAGLFAWQWLHPEEGTWTIRGTGISFGWLALILALYNLARWWSRRSSKANDRAVQAAWSQRRRQAAREEPGVESTPDPRFDFTEQPRNSRGAR